MPRWLGNSPFDIFSVCVGVLALLSPARGTINNPQNAMEILGTWYKSERMDIILPAGLYMAE
jgi:hypothetical protein